MRIVRARSVRCGVFAALLAVGGCGRADAGGDESAFAAIPAVENDAPAWTAGQAWRLSTEPVLEIGTEDGPDAYQFGGVSSGVRLSDGGVVVADWQAYQVRWFAADGTHRHSAGRKGGGPGEFQNLMALLPLPGDSVAALDPDAARVTIYDPQGRVARDFSFRERDDEAPPMPIGFLGDGRLLVERSLVDGIREDGEARRYPLLLGIRPAAPGVETHVIGRFRDREVVGMSSPRMRINMNRAFGAATYFATGGGRVYAGSSERYEIVQMDGDGKPLRRIRRTVNPEAVTDADREEDLRGIRERTAGKQSSIRDLREKMPYPALKPAFDALRVDGRGFLWVRRYPSPGGPTPWDVFDENGRLLGTVHTPAGLRVLHIGAGHLLGRATDELGVQRVRVYRIENREPPAR